MNPGKNRCEFLKEVRRRIAHENNIPLQQRECTYGGECSGTCPFCETEVQYLEKEIYRRRALGKAVTVAGIALSSLAIGACDTPSHVTPPSGNASGHIGTQIVITQDSSKISSQRTEYEERYIQVRGNVGSGTAVVDGVQIRTIKTETSATFPKEYGSPVLWLRHRLHSYRDYIAKEATDEAMILFVVNEDGRISDVGLTNMPMMSSGQDVTFLEEVRKQLMSMPRWKPATRDGKPTTSTYAIAIKDLR